MRGENACGVGEGQFRMVVRLEGEAGSWERMIVEEVDWELLRDGHLRWDGGGELRGSFS